MSDLQRIYARARTCEGIVYRDGEMECCAKLAVTIVDACDQEDGCYWPACAYHAHRYGRGRCVPLVELRAVVV